MPRTDLIADNGVSFHVGQTAAEVVALTAAAQSSDFGMIVELGTWRAGATYVLRLAAPDALIVSFDVARPMLTPGHWEALGRNTLLVEHDVLADPWFVIDMWRYRPAPVFLYCDNGNKPREVLTFAPFLRSGDVIGCHDWGHEINTGDVMPLLLEWSPVVPEQTEGTTCRFWRKP